MFQSASLAGRDEEVQTWARVRPHRLEPSGLEQHRGRLFRAAYALTQSKEDAEDLVQETYELVLRRPRFLRRGDARAYLLQVLRNRWAAQMQSASRRPSRPSPPEDLEWVVDERADPHGSPLEVKLDLLAQTLQALASRSSWPMRRSPSSQSRCATRSLRSTSPASPTARRRERCTRVPARS